MNDPRSVLMFGLWHSYSLATVTKSNGGFNYILPKHVVGLVEFSSAIVTKSLMEVVADSTWVYTVNCSNKLWCVLICVVFNRKKEVRKSI